MTAMPLMWFAIAARRMPYTMIGFLQFISPTVVFVMGLMIFEEELKLAQLGCFILIWAAATIFTGLAASLVTLFLVRVLLGVGEGATFPVATRAMADWTPASKRGWAQGITHSTARLGNAITPPLIAWLIAIVTWRGSFIIMGIVSFIWTAVWLWYFRDNPRDHPGITADEIEKLPKWRSAEERRKSPVPWGRLARRMMPVTIVYFCYGWTLWFYLAWIPLYFQQSYKLNLRNSALFAAGVFLGGVVGDTLGGVVSDRIYEKTGDRNKAIDVLTDFRDSAG